MSNENTTPVPAYELWPALTPKTEDVEKFRRAIEAEKRKGRRANWNYIDAAKRDMAIAKSLEVNF